MFEYVYQTLPVLKTAKFRIWGTVLSLTKKIILEKLSVFPRHSRTCLLTVEKKVKGVWGF